MEQYFIQFVGLFGRVLTWLGSTFLPWNDNLNISLLTILMFPALLSLAIAFLRLLFKGLRGLGNKSHD